MGDSSTIQATGNIDTAESPSVARARKRATKSFRDRLAGRVSESRQHVLNWNGKRFVITPTRIAPDRFTGNKARALFVAAAKKPVKLGRSTSLIVNPTMQQTRNRVGDAKLDSKRQTSAVEEGLGGFVGAAVGAYIGNKLRKRLQQRRTKAALTSGPWGPHVQNPTGPKIRQGSTETRSGGRSSSPPPPPPPPGSNRMSAADYRNLLRKNPTLKVSRGSTPIERTSATIPRTN